MTKEKLIEETKAFLLDLDGTLYLDDTPIGAVKETLWKLREKKKQLVFLTNNSSKTQKEYLKKLQRIGLYEAGDLIYTSAMATVSYLKQAYAGKKVYLLGTDALKEEFAGEVTLTEENPDVVVLAYDTTLTFAKMKKFDAFLKQGLPYIATHPDDVCPTKGFSQPDVGSFLALFEVSSGRKPSVICGKPDTVMGDALAARLKLPKAQMCMAGDRMYTDIRFANRNGMKSILVLSGETTAESRSRFPDEPDLILNTINDLL